MKLSKYCIYNTERIPLEFLSEGNYISTENMLPNVGGITKSSNLPASGNAIHFSKGDILISNIRPYFKKIWYADKEGGCSADVLCIRANEGIDSQYLYYLLSQQDFFDYVMAGAKGCKMPRGDKQHIMNWEVNVPDIDIQQKIANILYSLDDKIEVNRRINEQLEELAGALFKSWFVDFEPFKDGEFMESELGMIPEGWKVGKLGELCIFKRGKNLLSKNAIPGNVPVVAGGLEPSCYHNESNTKSPVVTVSGSGANAGFMRMYHQEVWASDCSFIDSSCENLLFVYCFLANNRALLKHAQTGAVQPHVKPSDIHDFDIVIPPKEIIDIFQEKIYEMLMMKGELYKEITHLSNLRDTLLPKLMSGEIDVNEVKI